MLQINAHTRQLAILGYPVEHSFSPQMHNFISQKFGNNYVYTALPVAPRYVEQAVNGLRALDFAGVNVTAPHKYEVMNYLDEISDKAKRYGSVNTIVNQNGKLIGHNTDADGFYISLKKNNIEIKDKDVLIVGAGGATKPVSVLFSEIPAKSITIINRTKSKAEELAEYVAALNGYKINTERVLDHYDVVINTTSAGMEPQEHLCPIDNMDFIDAQTAAVDMIYNPSETIFLQRAKANGAKIVNGLGMLIGQGILSYELFTNTKLPDDAYELIQHEVFGQ